MATPVHQLELPEINLFGLDRPDALVAMDAARTDHWLARMPIGYAVMNHDDVTAILRDRRFHSTLSVMPQMAAMAGMDVEFAQRRQRSILGLEGEDHARLRRIVASAFTPKSADRLRPFMREVVTRLVGEVAPLGRCDLVADVCEPYPIPIICELLGAPKEDWKLFSNWATDIFTAFNSDESFNLDRIRTAFEELDEYVRVMIEERRSSPRADLLSDLIAAEEAGDRLSTDEVVMLAEAVLMAGTDTTRNQLACSVALLLEHPDQWKLLASRPELAAKAVEETMRFLGAVRATARISSEDIVYRDVLFPKGTLVMTSLAGANFDPRVYEDPHRVDITREGASPHLSFGSGIHFCLGASLARAELQEALPILASRLRDLELDGPVEWKPSTVTIWGPAKLPLKYTPAA